MEKLDMQTTNIADKNFEVLSRMFPNAITEHIDESGKVVRAIDVDVLRQEIVCNVVEGREERYQFLWPDKKRAILLSNEPTNKTLRPVREDSIDFDNTENLYIEGDNLDVLKLLHETYLEKIKMIYIDPPYNTGKDFIYADNFYMNQKEYRTISGQYDEGGNKLVANPESNGRYHTDWLNMIYPRLKIARDLLQEDGVIFISIDDSEVVNTKEVCNEVFGEKNFVAQLIWQNKKGGGNDSVHIATEHEYILVYAKDKSSLGAFYQLYSEDYIKRYKEEDEIGKYFWDTFKRKSGKQYYPITCPDGTVLEYDDDGNPISWLRSRPRFEADVKAGEIRIVQNNNGGWSVQFKQRMPEGKKPRSLFCTEEVLTDLGTTSTGAADVYEYFKKDVFSNPKPVDLLEFILGFGMKKNDIVLDFFSGSATIAEAVMKANKLDSGNRKYIAVQLPEDIDEMLQSSSANAKRVAENAIQVLDDLGKPHLITELAKERIKRCSKKYCSNKDTGFRVLKLDSSNMKDIYYNPAEIQQTSLFGMADNIKEDRTAEDLLFQVMLDLGVLPSSKIGKINIAGKEVFNVAEGFLIACFDNNVTDDVVKIIAEKRPYYAVFRDSSMASDSVATNFEQIFASISPDTVRKVL